MFRKSAWSIACLVALFAAPLHAAVDLAWPPVSSTSLFADLNGDAIPDLVYPVSIPEGDCYATGIAARLLHPGGTLDPPQIHKLDQCFGSWCDPLVAADLFGHGRMDLVVRVGDRIAVLLNAGNGSFETPRWVPGTTWSLAAEDLDHDGDRDLVFAAEFSGIAVARLQADSTFATPVIYHTTAEDGGPFAIGDLNSDGFPDIVLGADGSYLPNLGSGTFGLPVSLQTAARGSVMLGDVDGGNGLDVVLVTANRTTVLRNDGSGQFTEGGYDSGTALLVADVDADTDLDIVTGADSACTLLLNDGNGIFTARRYGAVGGKRTAHAGDYDGDGRTDILVTGDTWLVPLWGAGGGVFTGGTAYGPFAAGWDAAQFDLGGDGRPDLVFWDGLRLEDLHSAAPASFESARRVPLGPYAGDLTLLDFDGDGITDVAGDDVLLRGVGDGRFSVQCTFGGRGNKAVADFDGDGRQDVATATTGSSAAIRVYLNHAGACPFGMSTPYAAGIQATRIVAGDFDADGDEDLAANGWANAVVLLWNDGSGTFGAPTYVDFGSASPAGLAAADFDGDGKLDLAGQGIDLAWMRNLGARQFAAPVRLDAGCAKELPAADLNGDGKPDLLRACTTAFCVLLNLGGGTFATPVSYATQGGLQTITVGELDGLVGPEVVEFIHDLSGRDMARIRTNRGDGSFDDGVLRANPFGAPPVAVVHDFTGDGRPDLMVPAVLYPNRTPTVSAVLVQDLQTARVAAGVELRWNLGVEAQRLLVGVRAQRAEQSAGPWVDLHADWLVPQGSMRFVDADPRAEVWYRLVLLGVDGTRWLAGPVQSPPELTGAPTLLRSVSQRGDGDGIEMRYSVGARGVVALAVHDARGRMLWELRSRVDVAGEHLQTWDGRDRNGSILARGVYFVSLRAGGVRSAQKLLVWHE